MGKPNKNREDENLEPYLTEYRALREEQKTRLSMNGTMLNFILLIIGAAIAAYVQMSIAGNEKLFTPILLGVPLLTTPITLFYYDHTIMVYRIGRYFETHLYPAVEAVLGHNPFQWDRVHRETSGQLFLMAFGRNLFFLLITLGPIILFLFFKLGYRNVGRCFLSLFTDPSAIWRELLLKLDSWELWLFGIDLALLIIVLAAWTHSGLYFMGWGRRKSVIKVSTKIRAWLSERLTAIRKYIERAQQRH